MNLNEIQKLFTYYQYLNLDGQKNKQINRYGYNMVLTNVSSPCSRVYKNPTLQNTIRKACLEKTPMQKF